MKLTNQQFVQQCKIDGIEIILDWDQAEHTYEEWCELILATYIELTLDLINIDLMTATNNLQDIIIPLKQTIEDIKNNIN